MAHHVLSGKIRKASACSSGIKQTAMSSKQKSMLVEQALRDNGSSTLQEMVNEVTDLGVATRDSCAHGESAEAGAGQTEEVDAMDVGGESSMNKDQVFPLMKLPAEIRNEIYRACLTRPFNVVLSKRVPPPPPELVPDLERECPEREGVVDLTQDESDTDGDVSGRPRTRPTVTRRGMLRSRRSSRLFANNGSQDAAGSTSAASSSSSQPQPTTQSLWSDRNTRPIRLINNRTASSTVVGTGSRRSTRPARVRTVPIPTRRPRPQDDDPLVVNILCVSKQVYQEARSILYSENVFALEIDTALYTLAGLHQRSRRQIKHIELEVPSYNEILDRFQETVRLALRYCWGLKKLVVSLPFTLPNADSGSTTTGNAAVYANGFDILRWLPRQCEVELKGNISAEIEAVVSKNATLAKTLDESEHAMRQLRTEARLSWSKYSGDSRKRHGT